MLLWLSMILTPTLLTAEPFDLERHEVRSWFSQLKGLDSKIPHHVGKGAKKIVIHHDGDEDGSVEKFEININDPAGNAETGNKDNETVETSSKINKHAEEAVDQQIKTTISEVEPLISVKLNEAVEAQALAEMFVPVANTDNAREAAEVVKEAVGNATKGLERVKEASNILKKVIVQTNVESMREEVERAKDSAEKNANITQSAPSQEAVRETKDALMRIDQTLDQLRANITEEEDIDDLLGEAMVAVTKAKSAAQLSTEEAAMVDPEETARVAAESAHLVADQLAKRDVGDQSLEVEVQEAANKSLSAAQKADELVAEIRGEKTKNATEVALQAVAERITAEKEKIAVEAKIRQQEGEKFEEEKMLLKSTIEETLSDVEAAQEGASKIMEEAMKNNPGEYVEKAKEKVDILKQKAKIIGRDIKAINNPEGEAPDDRLAAATNATLLSIDNEAEEVKTLLDKTLQPENKDIAAQATTILRNVTDGIKSLEAIKTITKDNEEIKLVVKKANRSASKDEQSEKQSKEIDESMKADAETAKKAIMNTEIVAELVSSLANDTSKENLRNVVEQAAEYIVESKKYDMITQLDEKIAEKEKISKIKRSVQEDDRKIKEAANAAEEKAAIAKTEVATTAAENAKALAEKSEDGVKKLEEIEAQVKKEQLDILIKDVNKAVRASQRETSDAIEVCFMATEDKAIQSAAIKAMQETEVAEAAATKVKDKATKLLKEENKAKRETEIKSIVVGTQKAWKAAEKAQSLAIEAALSAANVSPVAVATKFIEEDNKAATKVAKKLEEAKQLIANNSEVEKASGTIAAFEQVAEKTKDAAQNLSDSLNNVANLTDQDKLVKVAQDIILNSAKSESPILDDIKSLSDELVEKKRIEDVEKIKKESKGLLDQALLEEEKATKEAVASNPKETIENSAEKAKNILMATLEKITAVRNITNVNAALAVAAESAEKSAQQLEEIAKRSKESEDESESVELAKEAEKELKIVEQAKAVVEQADVLVKEDETKNQVKTETKELMKEIIEVVLDSTTSLNTSKALTKALNNLTEIEEAKLKAENDSEKAREAVDKLKDVVEKLAEPTQEVSADTLDTFEKQVKDTKRLVKEASKSANNAVDTALKNDPTETASKIVQIASDTVDRASKIASKTVAGVTESQSERAKLLAAKAVKAAQNAKNAAEVAVEESKRSANSSDSLTASHHAQEAKVFADQAAFEAKVSILATKQFKEELRKGTKCPENDETCGVDHLIDGITNLKEENSQEGKIETEVDVEIKGESSIGIIKAKANEAAETAKKSAGDALLSLLLTKRHLRRVNDTKEINDIITSIRELNQRANDYALEARQLSKKINKEKSTEVAKEIAERANEKASKAEEVAKEAKEKERQAAGIVAQQRIVNGDPNALATVHKVLQRAAAFILQMFNLKNKELALQPPPATTISGSSANYEIKPKEKAAAVSQKEGGDELDGEATLEVEANDQDVLSYIYN